MKFDMREWLRFYNKIHALGETLHDGRPTYTDKGDYIVPVAKLPKHELDELEFEIKTLSEKCNRYLDQCGMRKPKPLWYYDRKNKQTWASDPSFKYGHLVQHD